MFTSCRLVVLRMLLGVSANSDSNSSVPSLRVFASGGSSVGKRSLFVVSTWTKGSLAIRHIWAISIIWGPGLQLSFSMSTDENNKSHHASCVKIRVIAILLPPGHFSELWQGLLGTQLSRPPLRRSSSHLGENCTRSEFRRGSERLCWQ